jgi:2-dehydropantoate 2-reductase
LALVGTSLALIGPGAIGSTIAAFLHDAGYPVLICGHTPRESIEVRPDDGDPIVLPDWLARLCDERTVVCVLQNGVEQVERVGAHCPGAEVLPAAVWFSAQTQPQGWVRLRTGVRLVLPTGGSSERLAELLRDAGVTVDLDGDFATSAWHKLLTNAVAGLMVLTGRRSGMFRRADLAGLARNYLAECLAVARAEGATLDDSVIDEIVDMFSKGPET